MIAVLDFEATCAQRGATGGFDASKQEVIELPVALVDETRVVATFGTFVRPLHQPRLTRFCTELTSIRQQDVDTAPDIHEAIAKLQAWFDDNDVNETNTIVATCGDWDLKTLWPMQTRLEPTLVTPPLFRRWCNIKTVFSATTNTHSTSMMSMLTTLGITHQGRHHRGADDVANLCRVVLELQRRGAKFRR